MVYSLSDRVIFITIMTTSEKPVPVDPKAVGSVALGVAAGLVAADRMGRTSREVAAFALLSVGLVATVPFLTKYVKRQLNAPSHRFGAQKTLKGIRRSGVTDFSIEAEYNESQANPISA